MSITQFDKMLSYNIFINNNNRLRTTGVLPEWVDWVQLGAPTPSQRKYRIETLLNIRMQTNNGKFLICGRAVLENGQVKLESWDQQFIQKTRAQINGSPQLIGLSSEMKTILERIVREMDLYEEITTADLGKISVPQETDIATELGKHLALQSFFWKAERQEVPPLLTAKPYTKEEISDEFAS